MVNSVSPDATPKKGISALLQFVAVSVITGVVSAGLALPAVGVGSASVEGASTLFDQLPASLEEGPLAQQSVMLAADGTEIARFFWQNRKEVDIKDISQDMQDATVAIEDYRFFEHGGVDLEGIGRAVVFNMLSSETQGGSTLTQQYVKNVLVEASNSKGDRDGIGAAKESQGAAGYARKLREAKLAVAVEKKYGKMEILNRYLNINNYSGSPNSYGVQAAAYHYWGKSAKDLNLEQSAMLAGIVKNPSLYNPEKNPEGTLERRNVVLKTMLTRDFIDQKQYDEAVKTKLDLKITQTPNGCAAAGGAAFYCDYVQRIIETDKAFGDSVEDRREKLQRGGLTIKTSLNPKMQKAAEKAVKKRVPAKDASGAGHTAVTVEPGTGKVPAMAQNKNYTVSSDEKSGDTNLNYNVDAKYNGGSGFQVGSTWKPFVLAAWLKSGRSLSTTVNATKRNFPAGSWKYNGCPNNGGNWDPNNAGDGKGQSSMTALNATKQSVNTAYAAMANQLNMCSIKDTAQDLGVRYGSGDSLDTTFDSGGVKLTQALLPSSVLGATEVAPIDMAAAYGVFASGGTYCRPTPISEITDRSGKKIDIPQAGCKRVLDKKIAAGVAFALTQTFNGGTTSGLGIGVPAGAKTGTTNFEVGSTWLLGFTKKLSTAVWTGDPRGTRDWRKNSKGKVRGTIYGATFSGKTWQAYMRKAVKYTKGNTGFPSPGRSIVGANPNQKPSSGDRPGARDGGDRNGDRRGGGNDGGGDDGGGDAGLGGN